METFKKFISSIAGSLILVAVILAATYGVLNVAGTDGSVIALVIEIAMLITVIYVIVTFAIFRKKDSWKSLYEREREEKLELKEEMTESRQEMEDYFLTWVHQIKTPITAAKLLADDNPQLKQQLISIETYTNMAMEYLKAINQEGNMTVTAVSIDAMVRPLIKKYSTLFISNNIRLEYSRIDNTVVTDSQLAQVVIEQLISNAVKYTSDGTISITFDSENNQLKIKDTGIGIDPADLPKIFDKGYSGLNGRQNQKSSGIGLFLAKIIGEKLNLKLSVVSEPGKGSCFTVKFPDSVF